MSVASGSHTPPSSVVAVVQACLLCFQRIAIAFFALCGVVAICLASYGPVRISSERPSPTTVLAHFVEGMMSEGGGGKGAWGGGSSSKGAAAGFEGDASEQKEIWILPLFHLCDTIVAVVFGSVMGYFYAFVTCWRATLAALVTMIDAYIRFLTAMCSDMLTYPTVIVLVFAEIVALVGVVAILRVVIPWHQRRVLGS